MSDATLLEEIEHYGRLIKEYEALGWHYDAARVRRHMEELEREQREAVSAAAQKRVDAHAKKDPTWWQWAMLQYRIDPIPSGFRVVSLCCEWKEERSWDFYSLPEAQEKVIQLVDWKDQDRNRGRGNIDQDLQKGRNV